MKRTFRSVITAFILLALFAAAFTPLDSGSRVIDAGAEQLPYLDTSLTFEERAADLVGRMTIEEKISQLTVWTSAIPRLGLSSYNYWREGLHGICDEDVTVFPTGLSLGTTWNTELIETIMAAASDEGRAVNSNLNYFSPTINLLRDPRWGRNYEAYSEDPYLTAQLGASFVNGLQGYDDRYLKLSATIKHYLANNSENNRANGDSVVDERDLYEYYTYAFKEIIENTDVTSVMSSYNRVNGIPMCCNEEMLTELLRWKWGFDGFVVSDCWAVRQVVSEHKWEANFRRPVTYPEASAISIKSGNDFNCGNAFPDYLLSAFEQGLVTEDDLDTALVRAITMRMKTGEFDPDYMVPYKSDEYTVENQLSSAEHLALAEKAAEEAVVLLKNDIPEGETESVLPINAAQTNCITVVGQLADVIFYGDYSGIPKAEYSISFLDAFEELYHSLNPGGTVIHIQANNGVLSEEEAQIVAGSDVVIAYLGTVIDDGGEGRDRSRIYMPYNQGSLASKLAELNPKTAVYMQTCGLVELQSFNEDVAAITWSSYNGQAQAGAARVLFGLANPSGKLSFTWYSNLAQTPDLYDYSIRATNTACGRTYWYYTGDMSYPFGHGLSYTGFDYSNIAVSAASVTPNDTVTVTADITNSGSVDGYETVQLYVITPDAAAKSRPEKRLKGFDKVYVDAGDTVQVSFELEIADLYYWDSQRNKETYDLGEYTIQLGSSSSDIRLSETVSVGGERLAELYSVHATGSKTVFRGGSTEREAEVSVKLSLTDESILDNSLASISYTSSNPNAVSVDENGKMTAVSNGTALITVEADYNGVKASDSFPVAVVNITRAESIRVAGVPLEGFEQGKLVYYYDVTGLGTPPTVSASVSAGIGASVTVVQAVKIPGYAKVRVAKDTVITDYYIYMYSRPSSPSIKRISTGNARFVISWSAPESAGGGRILKYIVTVDETEYETDGETLAMTVKELENGREYAVTVDAVNEVGRSMGAEASYATPRGANPVVSGVSNGGVYDLADGAVSAQWDVGTATLNGDAYTAGAPITEAGAYTLVVNGNGRTVTVAFTVTGELQTQVAGDIDGDGYVTVSDALSVLRMAVGLTEYGAAELAAGDVDGDGVMTVGDALAVLREAVGLR